MATTSVQLRSENFLDTIGINTHIAWQGGSSAYTNQANITNALEYLGVEYIRDGVPYENYTLPYYKSLADAGIKFNLVVTNADFNATGNFSATLGHIASLERIAPGSVASIQGLNEFNVYTVNYNGQNSGSNLAVGRAVQELLWSQVKANPVLDDIPILSTSTGKLFSHQVGGVGDMAGVSDFGAWHAYFGQGDQPYTNISRAVEGAKSLNSQDPVQITESGNYTAVNDMSWGGGGVTEEVQAKLGLNLLMDAAKLGVVRTYLYELLDNGLTPANNLEGSFGLFRADGSPKQVATAIHNLNAILGDSGANAESFATWGLDFSVQGLGSNGNTLLMQNSNGHHQLAIWAEPDIWNQDTRSAIGAPVQQVTVNLGQTAASIQAFDPLRGTAPIATANNAGSITVQVTDHPIILDIAGTAAADALPQTAGGAAATIGSGPDTLVLRISQDAWNGDAQYTVSIDGTQLGGVRSASAAHGSGASDTLTLQGDWGVGEHRLAVSFLNDAYAGTPATDRNLYIDGITYNGEAVRGGSATMLSAGSIGFTLSDATPAGVDWAL